MEGIPDEWRSIVTTWAVKFPRIRQVYAFGSRAKGNHRDDSDLDLALFVEDAPGETALTYAIFHSQEIVDALASNLPVQLDIEFAYPDDKIVLPAVLEHGVLLFDAEL